MPHDEMMAEVERLRANGAPALADFLTKLLNVGLSADPFVGDEVSACHARQNFRRAAAPVAELLEAQRQWEMHPRCNTCAHRDDILAPCAATGRAGAGPGRPCPDWERR